MAADILNPSVLKSPLYNSAGRTASLTLVYCTHRSILRHVESGLCLNGLEAVPGLCEAAADPVQLLLLGLTLVGCFTIRHLQQWTNITYLQYILRSNANS